MGHKDMNGALKGVEARFAERVHKLILKGMISTSTLRRLLKCSQVEMMAKMDAAVIALPPSTDGHRKKNGESGVVEVGPLKDSGTVEVGPLTGTFNSSEFFQSDPAVMVLGDLAGQVLSSRVLAYQEKAVSLTHWDFARDALDYEIHLWFFRGRAVSYWHIGWLINQQRNGEAGKLANDGRAANYFFVAGEGRRPKPLKLRLVWQEGKGKWAISAWHQGGVKFHEGDRLFHR